MKRILIAMVLFSICLINNIQSQTLPAKDTVLSKMLLANKYFMDKWPDPGEDIVTDKTRPSNLWTRATYHEGLMALYYTYHDTNFYKYSVEWGVSHNWEPTYGYLNTRNADNYCCGQTYIELYIIDKQPEKITPIKTCIDYIVESNDDSDWSWIDAIQMGMPVFAKLGVALEDTNYFNKMNKMYLYSRNIQGGGLYNEEEHLWWRDKDFVAPYTTPNGKNCYWSRGNGWVYAALVRVLDVLPDTVKYRAEYLKTFKEMSDTLMKLQRYDGFWNPSLTDSLDYGGKETSGTAFFTYGLAWGINNGILDETTYKPCVTKAWNGMIEDALHDNGFLGYMQGTGKQPSDGQPLSYDKAPNFEDYGLGAFLLAGSEVIKLAPGELTRLKPITHTLTINTTGEGNISPENDIYNEGTTIELTATPAKGWKFDGWSGDASGSENPINIVINTDKNISATFSELPIYTLVTSVIGSGTVTDGGTFYSGESVRLRARPASGWKFDGWSGDITGTVNPKNISIDSNINVTATFSLITSTELTLANDYVRVYPNPVNEAIYIEINSINDEFNIELFDVTGKLFYNNKYKSSDIITLNVSDLRKGIYYIKVFNNNFYTSKIIIKN